MAKKKINYAEKSLLSPDEFDPKNAKVMVSAWIDEDVFDLLKTTAESRGLDYKLLINQILKDHFKLRSS
jgi:hypothetical protein